MGCYLSLSTQFAVRRPLKDDELQSICDYLDGWCFDFDYDVEKHTISISGGDSMAWASACDFEDWLFNVVNSFAADYAIVTGECDGEHSEYILIPEHLNPWDANIRWRKAKIAKLEEEIHYFKQGQALGDKHVP